MTKIALRLMTLGALVAFASSTSCQRSPDKGTAASGTLTLNASGSSFQAPFQQAAIEAFRKTHPAITINYAAGGSGLGRQQLADGVVDFAGSDAPYRAEDLAKVRGGALLYFPLLLGPITISYNLPAAATLALSPRTIAMMFQRDIVKWNDPAILSDNPGAHLPATDIVVVRRSDASGTTESFTRYLDVAAAGTWRLKTGATVEWSPDTQAGPGNGGVAQIVKSTPGAIGYVDLSDATAAQLTYADVQNAAGKFVAPTPGSASAAGDGITMQDDLVFSAIDARGEASYPITYQTWLIAYAKPRDPAKGAALAAYLAFLLSDAQQLLPGLDYAPLPQALRAKAIAQLDKLER